eukprot:3258994-Pyramimonas_sp.AAC.1
MYDTPAERIKRTRSGAAAALVKAERAQFESAIRVVSSLIRSKEVQPLVYVERVMFDESPMR